MKKQKKPKLKLRPKPVPHPTAPVPTTQPSRLRRFFKWGVGLALTVSGLVALADFARDQYAKTIPEIAPKEETTATRSPSVFIIKNASPYFDMNEVRLLCGIDTASFDVG